MRHLLIHKKILAVVFFLQEWIEEKLQPKFVEKNGATEVHFNADLTEEQKIISESSTTQSNEFYKYTDLNLWSNLLGNKDYEGNKKYDEKSITSFTRSQRID